jgi:aminoglycoside 6'-N-acetyltransferase
VPDLTLEPVRPQHAEELRALRAAPAGWPLALEDGVEGLTVLVDGAVAGYVQFWEEPAADYRHADMDVFLGPGFQGRGLGGEAIRSTLRLLLEERGHHRVTLGTAVDNTRAIGCYEKAGFRRVGVMRKAALSHLTGEWEDELLMEYVV